MYILQTENAAKRELRQFRRTCWWRIRSMSGQADADIWPKWSAFYSTYNANGKGKDGVISQQKR